MQSITKIVEQLQQLGINDLCDDSRKIQLNNAFVARCGHHTDGNLHISQAIAKGAKCIITDTKLDLVVPVLVIKDLTIELPEICKVFYQDVSSKLNLIAVTGTNGKTTISYLLSDLFDSLHHPAATIGTIGCGRLPQLSTTGLTTPSLVNNYQLLYKFNQQHIKNITMETSSIGLAEGRISGMKFTTGIFTNLTNEHLDYHQNMEQYALAKLGLFTDYNLDNMIINIDDQFSKQILDVNPGANIITYGLSQADFTAHTIKLGVDGVEFTMQTPVGEYLVKSNLLGKYNVYNILAITACLYVNGFKLAVIIDKLRSLPNVPGRMQYFSANNINIYVDYAHTPDALSQSLVTLKALTTGRLICVFGCGGERAIDKRALMGSIAVQLADIIYLTDDNPRNEDPDKIIADILLGMRQTEQVEIIHDRKAAIVAAIGVAKPNDCVLIAGKGHETYQIYGDKMIAFDEASMVQEIINNLS